jgi:glutathione S-transferase
MQIYWFKAQAPRRVLALVRHLGIQAELIEVDMMAGGLKTPAYAALNPNKKAPLLIDGDLALPESAAIMAYLCIKAGSDMWPAHNPAEQVEVLRWLSWGDSHWGPAVGPFYFEYIVKGMFKIGPPDIESLKTKVNDFKRFAAVLDAHLAERVYIACGRLTIADFQLASMVMYWREAAMPLQEFANIIRWIETLLRIPAWAEPWPASKFCDGN